MTWKEFSEAYCETQDATPDELAGRLREVATRYKPDGFMLLRCQMMDSSQFGQRTILPYGPNNTYRTVPTHPVSPRGLASDMSTVEGTISAADIPTDKETV